MRMKRGLFCWGRRGSGLKYLDLSHYGLEGIPDEVYEHMKTLEELNLEANQIKDLPKDLFSCHNLQKLVVADNELISLPNSIANLIHLVELDISKNAILDFPETIKCCKNLTAVEASVNPIGKLPEGFTQLLNLTELYLNDTFLEYLPSNFGRLSKLRILELRENHLKFLPKSISRLVELMRLDLGNNDFEDLPDVLGSLKSLQEMWVDSNKLRSIPSALGQLVNMIYFDASKNQIECIPAETGGMVSLIDLHLSFNMLDRLPDTIGNLTKLQTLLLDDNQLKYLPQTIGSLVSMEELVMSNNELKYIPPGIGQLRLLKLLNVDENILLEIPSELGSCGSITVLSMRNNNLQTLPDELGHLSNLRVLNLSNNKLLYLPFSFTKLHLLSALWLSHNQSQPLIPLQTEVIEATRQRVLTCFMFPQQAVDMNDDVYASDVDYRDTHNPTRNHIMFQVDDNRETDSGKFNRSPSPYPKEKLITTHKPSTAKVTIDPSLIESSELQKSSNASVKEAKVAKSTHIVLKMDKKQTPEQSEPSEKQQKDKKRLKNKGETEEPTATSLTPPELPKARVEAPKSSMKQYFPDNNKQLVVLSPSSTAPSTASRKNLTVRSTSDDRDRVQSSPISPTNRSTYWGNPSPSPPRSFSDINDINTSPNKGTSQDNSRETRGNSKYQPQHTSSPSQKHAVTTTTNPTTTSSDKRYPDKPSSGSSSSSRYRYTQGDRRHGYPPSHDLVSDSRSGSGSSPIRTNCTSSRQSSDSTSRGRHTSTRHDDINTERIARSPSPDRHPPTHRSSLDTTDNNRPSPSPRKYRDSRHSSDQYKSLNHTSTTTTATSSSSNSRQYSSSSGGNHEPVGNSDSIRRQSSNTRSPSRHHSSTHSSPDSSPTRQAQSIIERCSVPAAQTNKQYHNRQSEQIMVVVHKNPGLGFAIASGVDSTASPQHQSNKRKSCIYITKISPGGPASTLLQPGDRILQVDGRDFTDVSHASAVSILKNCGPAARIIVERK